MKICYPNLVYSQSITGINWIILLLSCKFKIMVTECGNIPTTPCLYIRLQYIMWHAFDDFKSQVPSARHANIMLVFALLLQPSKIEKLEPAN
mmetsp:Transcript_7222/g.9393  ORF Transcript_7222/g.9393 Transcript_7222/m.9393 type:complete len:92 (-) Transcript_7222:2714-2989(-)